MGFAVMRAPASGAKIRKADYPDIVAIKEGKVAVFEVKARRTLGHIYLEAEQVKKLKTFAQRAGGIAYIAVKIPREGWKLIKATELTETKGGRLKLSKEEITRAPDLKGLLTDLGLTQDLEKYLSSKSKT
ncbi:MAG: Holliday junction resolvase [Desulfurococcales archaeon]|nr:Holliday junction resolvase [Desulfurococcales archaeon]